MLGSDWSWVSLHGKPTALCVCVCVWAADKGGQSVSTNNEIRSICETCVDILE